jgi:hypothetical protein
LDREVQHRDIQRTLFDTLALQDAHSPVSLHYQAIKLDVIITTFNNSSNVVAPSLKTRRGRIASRRPARARTTTDDTAPSF